ncbi:MAG: MFS transporter, partial [Peptococcaceae bacterium]|nr:MFS transporter [Peptococcaceae bacterium]
KTWKFYALWFMLFINITCGIALLSVASPILQETTGMSAVAAASIVGVMGIFNGGGRLGWATLSDYFGRDVVYTGFFVLEIVAMLILGNVQQVILFQVFLFIVMTCYGGGFSCIPAYLGDVFGTKHLSSIHGRILTAWACAGIVGPCIISAAKEMLSTYQDTLFIFAVLYACALVVSAFLLYKLRTE